jgi:hypothetical protein
VVIQSFTRLVKLVFSKILANNATPPLEPKRCSSSTPAHRKGGFAFTPLQKEIAPNRAEFLKVF